LRNLKETRSKYYGKRRKKKNINICLRNAREGGCPYLNKNFWKLYCEGLFQ
jgi:hypothetical protein